MSYSADVEAGWAVKGGRSVYGYKIHGAVDEAHGFILGGHTTAAQVSATTALPQVLEEASGVPSGAIVGADKGYDSQDNRDYLASKGYGDGIMRKAQRNKPLSEENKKRNAAVSKTRWIVERSFGTLKKVQRFVRARCLGLVKVDLEFHLQALAHNVRKVINLAV